MPSAACAASCASTVTRSRRTRRCSAGSEIRSDGQPYLNPLPAAPRSAASVPEELATVTTAVEYAPSASSGSVAGSGGVAAGSAAIVARRTYGDSSAT